jgi:RNA polymerase sigma-70 factor (ECF subfamily)
MSDLLLAARHGDRSAFDRLVAPHRRELHAHCYRMLGSVHDADDAVQDTMLRAWRGLGGFAGRSSLRTWLITIATNACLALSRRNGRRHLPIDLRSTARGEDVAWLEPYPTTTDPADGSPEATIQRQESVELAFVAAVQQLSAHQRAVLLLRDVLGYSAEETASVLGTTVTAANSALARARRQLRRPVVSQHATLRDLGDDGVARLVTGYVDAWERNDPHAFVSLLTEDATFSMPPRPERYRGRAAIARFVVDEPMTVAWRLLPIVANGQLAFGCYTPDEHGWHAHSIDVLTVRDDRIAGITAFLRPSLLSRFGLPERLIE